MKSELDHKRGERVKLLLFASLLLSAPALFESAGL
jgi:hypothetical protein